ncbi:MAG TPA: MBL fold metallo-hydrolase [Acidobacteriota bacterium]|nr:MBL fold metallo-hydrolase [Acidobacteriota bacterium]
MTAILWALTLLAALTGTWGKSGLQAEASRHRARPAQSAPTQDPGPGGTFHAVEAAEGVTVFIQDETLLYPVQGNITLIECQSYALVVDSGRTPSWAAAVIKEIRERTSKPVRYLVNTHWHGDHHHGNQVFLESFPGIEIVAVRETRWEILNPGKRSLEGQIRIMENREQLLQMLDANSDSRGNPLRPDRRYRIERLAGLPEQYLEELRAVRLTPPTLMFDERLVLGEGQDRIEIFSYGPGNTNGDAIVYLPGRKVVVTGDVLISTVPFMHETHARGWLKRLREIEALDVDVIIPGHGPLQRTPEWLQRHIDLLETIIAAAEEAVERGESLEQFRDNIDLESFRQAYSKGHDFLIHEFDNRVSYSAVPSAYRETLRERRRLQGSATTAPLADPLSLQHKELKKEADQLQVSEGAASFKSRALAQLQSVEAALQKDFHLLALERSNQALNSLKSTSSAFSTDGSQPDSLEAFQDYWQGIKEDSAALHQNLMSHSYPAEGKATPLAVRAMADGALLQAMPYVNAAGLYARSTSVSNGLYYLGRGLAQLEWAQWCRQLTVDEAGPQLALKEDVASILQDLEERTGQAFEDPDRAIDSHSDFIQLNASLKKARELLQAEGPGVSAFSALLPLMEGEQRLHAILAAQAVPSRADRQWAMLETWQQRLNASPSDHSLALLFLQRARAQLREASGENPQEAKSAEEQEASAQALRTAASILEGALPAYFSWVRE